MPARIYQSGDYPGLVNPPLALTVTGCDSRRVHQSASDQATRLLLHCFFRHAWSCIDLTYGGGGCWRGPLPPGLKVATNIVSKDFQARMLTGPDAAIVRAALHGGMGRAADARVLIADARKAAPEAAGPRAHLHR